MDVLVENSSKSNLLLNMVLNVTSFSSISYCSKSEYWAQKRIQSESIRSTILDVHVLKAVRFY